MPSARIQPAPPTSLRVFAKITRSATPDIGKMTPRKTDSVPSDADDAGNHEQDAGNDP